MGKLTGKTILITGGANGVGASTAELFCREGGQVVFIDRYGTKGRGLETKLVGQGLNAHFIEADISKVAEAARAVAEAFKNSGFDRCAVQSRRYNHCKTLPRFQH